MLATFTSILPNGFSFSNKEDKERERERERQKDRENGHGEVNEEETPRAPQTDKMSQTKETVDELGAKKERRRERSANETFIIVRPPPSVSNHPLNLQIQLVPPSTKDRTASGSSNRRSVDYSTAPPDSGEVGVPLARSQSARSNRSDASTFYAGSSASTTSMSSLASTATGSSVSGGRRMIVPLYNLSAHNVMTNTVLDAGTDAKVAKFHKRGLEVLGMAVLECVEVWPSYPRGHVAFLVAHGKENVLLDRTASKESTDHSNPHTPTSSALSLSSAGSHQPPFPPHPGSPATPVAHTYSGRVNLTPTPTGAKKIFGKIFKKKESAVASPGHSRGTSIGSIDRVPDTTQLHAATTKNRRSYAGSISPTPSHFSNAPPLPNSPHIIHTPTASTQAVNQPILQPPILDIQPTLSSPINPPVGRATKYVWIVKKWLKGTEGGLFGGVIRGAANIGANMGVSALSDRASGSIQQAAAGVEVRFEWLRGVSKSHQKVQSRRSSGMQKRPDESQTSLGGTRRSRTSAPVPSGGRKSVESTRSRSPHGRNGAARGRSAREPSLSRERQTDSLGHGALSEEHGASPKSSMLTEEPDSIQDHTVEDDGEESDPEDSETPWTCWLVVSAYPSVASTLWEHEHLQRDNNEQHLHPLASSRSHGHVPSGTGVSNTHSAHDSHDMMATQNRPGTSSGDRRGSKISEKPEAPGTLLRLKVGTLSPAPHHPKVVAQLRCPFPLPDVEVERARIRKRILTPQGHVARQLPSQGGPDDGPGGEGLLLTAEEIKDMLSCTAFWVVVREGFGGVGKVNRKGDGWRIRA